MAAIASLAYSGHGISAGIRSWNGEVVAERECKRSGRTVKAVGQRSTGLDLASPPDVIRPMLCSSRLLFRTIAELVAGRVSATERRQRGSTRVDVDWRPS